MSPATSCKLMLDCPPTEDSCCPLSPFCGAGLISLCTVAGIRDPSPQILCHLSHLGPCPSWLLLVSTTPPAVHSAVPLLLSSRGMCTVVRTLPVHTVPHLTAEASSPCRATLVVMNPDIGSLQPLCLSFPTHTELLLHPLKPCAILHCLTLVPLCATPSRSLLGKPPIPFHRPLGLALCFCCYGDFPSPDWCPSRSVESLGSFG